MQWQEWTNKHVTARNLGQPARRSDKGHVPDQLRCRRLGCWMIPPVSCIFELVENPVAEQWQRIERWADSHDRTVPLI